MFWQYFQTTIDQNEPKTPHEIPFYLQAIIVDHYYYCLKPTFDFRTRLKIIKKREKENEQSHQMICVLSSRGGLYSLLVIHDSQRVIAHQEYVSFLFDQT